MRRPPNGAPIAFVRSVLQSETDECIIWPFSLSMGYGQLWVDGVRDRAHRLVCIKAHGQPPFADAFACHSCGNRACVNPRHIRWADQIENMADKLRHGTSNRGSRHGMSRLTEGQVRVIKRRLKHGAKQNCLAKSYGVSKQTINYIASGKTWAWLKEPVDA